MTWNECEIHSSVFCDSSVHEECPACLSDRLKQSLRMLHEIHQKNIRFEIKLLEWAESGMEYLASTDPAHKSAGPKIESEKEELFASVK